jgi:hypothetical protein
MKILLLLLAVCGSAHAAPQAYHLSLQLSRAPFNRDLLFPDQTSWDYETRLRWDVGWGRWFSDNVVTGRTFNSRYRYVSWEFETGFRLINGLDAIWHHHSQHAIDLDRSKFPVIDSYGVRLTFLNRPKP